MQDPRPWILDPGLWIQDPGLWIKDPGLWIKDPGSWLVDPGLWIQDPGSRILDLEFDSYRLPGILILTAYWSLTAHRKAYMQFQQSLPLTEEVTDVGDPFIT